MPGVLARLGARARVGDEERAAETGGLVDDGELFACAVASSENEKPPHPSEQWGQPRNGPLVVQHTVLGGRVHTHAHDYGRQ